MAQAYPASEFIGFDYHEASIRAARRSAEKAGLGSRIRFEAYAAKDIPGGNYDLVTTLDCLHDMGDPVGAARHIFSVLKKDGTWMIVEPYAGDSVADNLTPIGRLYYCASVLLCVPGALSQDEGHALGGQAGEKRVAGVARQGGFTRFRRAAETPINIVYEARP